LRRFLKLLIQRKTLRQIAPRVREISNRCHGEVWERVHDRIFDMDLNEARGYIRARAMMPIRSHIKAEIGTDSHLSPDARQQLMLLVTERVVHSVVTDFITGSRVARRSAA